MKKMPAAILATLALLCGSAGVAAADDSAALERGAEVLAPFKARLKAALLAGMSEGPAHAIDVCRLEAPAIAAAASVEGVRVGRTSHRLRNPDNLPPAWVAPLLDDYVRDPTGLAPRAVALPDGRAGYVEPIVVQPLCLACHGESLAPEVAARLREAYPDDRATGFDVGDFRGLYWAELPTQQ